jgi:hypothetical protein
MDTTRKLRELIAEYRAEAAKCTAAADDLEAVLKRTMNGSGDHAVKIRGRRMVEKPKLVFPKHSPIDAKSALLTAVDVLMEEGKPIHITDLVDLVSKKRGKLTPRASVESVLVRAYKDGKFGVDRTAPGTYAVKK